MVKITSPLCSKDLDAGANLKGMFGIHGRAIEVFDNERMVILNLKKGERLAVFDKNDHQPYELSSDSKGRLNWRKLWQ